MTRGVIVGVAAIGVVLAALTSVTLSALASASHPADERAFLRYVERAAPAPGLDRTWWSQHEELVLAEGWASCRWLEDLPALDPAANPLAWELRARYLRESDVADSFNGDAKLSNRVVESAWAHLCIETRNRRTSIPAPSGGYD